MVICAVVSRRSGVIKFTRLFFVYSVLYVQRMSVLLPPYDYEYLPANRELAREAEGGVDLAGVDFCRGALAAD